ncbi:unnamed protein product [Lota lota]
MERADKHKAASQVERQKPDLIPSFTVRSEDSDADHSLKQTAFSHRGENALEEETHGTPRAQVAGCGVNLPAHWIGFIHEQG